MVLVFDVLADLAMFRKSYTTTSQVSYSFPPPTAVAGLLAAITGIDHNAAEHSKNAAFWKALSGTRIAVAIKNPIRWFSTTINLLKYKSPNANLDEHIQSKHQLLKNPCYRIYVKDGTLYEALKQRLEKREFIFTPYLGTAYALADILYCGEFEEKEIEELPTWVDTIIPLYEGVKPDVKKSGPLHREVVPYRMNENRELQSTVAVVYSDYPSISSSEEGTVSGRLWLKEKGKLQVSQVGAERVSWFEPW